MVQPRSLPLMLEVARHVGQRDVHGRDVEDHHQLCDAEQGEQGTAGHERLRFVRQTVVSELVNQTVLSDVKRPHRPLTGAALPWWA